MDIQIKAAISDPEDEQARAEGRSPLPGASDVARPNQPNEQPEEHRRAQRVAAREAAGVSVRSRPRKQALRQCVEHERAKSDEGERSGQRVSRTAEKDIGDAAQDQKHAPGAEESEQFHRHLEKRRARALHPRLNFPVQRGNLLPRRRDSQGAEGRRGQGGNRGACPSQRTLDHLLRHRGQTVYWHPAPVHMQPPDEQSGKEQCEPGEQASMQPPDEHMTMQVAPTGQDVLQCPLEQSTTHFPLPQ